MPENTTPLTQEEQKERRERLREILDQLVGLTQEARSLESDPEVDEGPESDCFLHLEQMECSLSAADDALFDWCKSEGDEP